VKNALAYFTAGVAVVNSKVVKVLAPDHRASLLIDSVDRFNFSFPDTIRTEFFD
jgi:hypothetical protein